jgi:periplasmic divalent cation tolerance protein
MSHRLIYVTTANRDEAVAIGRALVGERLAACANVIDGLTSIFRWQEAVQEDGETALILKTRADLVGPLTERVKTLHSYECPCVVALPIDAGNPAFLDWITEETSPAVA